MNDERRPAVLIISRDCAQFAFIRSVLVGANYQVVELSTWDDIPKSLEFLNPQLVLVDVHLFAPGVWALTHTLRTDVRFYNLPLVVMGEKIESNEKIELIEAGVDLCLTGPLFPKEMLARFRALARRVELGLFQKI
jgi:DNA-binding response OmpR family regulator